MGLRFRRSFRVAPGLRLNFSGSGVSASVGPRGLSATFGRRGTFVNAGIPGTGLYTRTKVGTPAAQRRDGSAPGTTKVDINVIVSDEGNVRFEDGNGQPVSQDLIDKAKRQHGEKIRKLIQDACDKINARVEALGSIHLQTPAPDERLRFEPRDFDAPTPIQPAPKPYGLLGRFFKSHRDRIDSENANHRDAYEKALKDWRSEKVVFEGSERARKVLLEERVLVDTEAMEEVLEGALQGIAWPRETAISAEVRDSGRLVLLDVDLPEIEDMPKTTGSVPGRGYKLTVKDIPATKLQKLYMEHVHGIGFRILGEVFAVLPNAQEVILSAFSQRPNKATAAVADEYLYSVRVKRSDWQAIDFKQLGALDVLAALERFELRRDLTKLGVFRPIEPLGIST